MVQLRDSIHGIARSFSSHYATLAVETIRAYCIYMLHLSVPWQMLNIPGLAKPITAPSRPFSLSRCQVDLQGKTDLLFMKRMPEVLPEIWRVKRIFPVRN